MIPPNSAGIPAGPLADSAHLLSGIALALSFVLLYQQLPYAMVRAYAAQALAAALLAALQGWQLGSASSVLGGTMLAAGAMAMPFLLRRSIGAGRGSPLALPAASGSGVVPMMVVGVAVVAVAVLAVQTAPLPLPGAATPTREDLAFALAIVLLGLLAAASRPQPLGQVIGLLSMWNGLVLAAAGTGGPVIFAAGSAGLLAPAAAALLPVMAPADREARTE